MTEFDAPPPPKWQAKRAALRDSNRKFYTFKKGQVEQFDFDKFSDLKRAKSEEIARNKGKFYSIEKPESLLNKRKKVQDKLWYYDKRNYPPRPKPEFPQYNMFYIRRPNTADRTRKEIEAQRQPTPIPEPKKELPKKEPPKKEPPQPVLQESDSPKAKTPDPEPPRRESPRKNPPKPKTPEPEQIYQPRPRDPLPQLATVAAVSVAAPMVKAIRNSYKTTQSINTSMLKYRY